MKKTKELNSTEIFEQGYICGYNQCRYDKGEISREELVRLVRKGKKEGFVFR